LPQVPCKRSALKTTASPKLSNAISACVQWLYECAAAGEVVPLMPRHYISISAATLESLDDVSRFCDPCALTFWPTLC
jgi:hypothetical protein